METARETAMPSRLPPTPAEDPRNLERLILRDQLETVRRSVRIAIPVNVILGLAGTMVAARAGHGVLALSWFTASTLVNLARMALCRMPVAGLSDAVAGGRVENTAARSIAQGLCLSWLAALLSGTVWAFVPLLCEGYAAPQSKFFLVVVCGITAGAVTHGTTYARVPLAFIVPPLLVTAGSLIRLGDFDHICLAATVLLYLLALARSAFQSEANFRAASRIKNETAALAASRTEAHRRASALAEAMRERAIHDVLTGLLNRAGFMQELEGAALDRRPAGLMLLDLDGFKSVNDVYGHKAGDRVLAEVAHRLRAALPAPFTVSRLGGDEFAIHFPSDAIVETPEALARRLIEAATAPFDLVDAGRLGASVGIHLDAGGTDPTERLLCADEALYVAKRTGRNAVCLFDETLRKRLDMRCDCERDIAQALAERTLEVWFQPIRAGADLGLAGLEALVRWRHPRHGWVPPQDLVAAAAMAGLAEPLLRFILDEACAMVAALRRCGLPQVRVAMNVSPREMSQLAVDVIVRERLDALGLPPQALEIEITEEIALDISAVRGKLAALSEAGVRLAIDDFGVGYSSLASLRQLQADSVKIDRSFVTGIAGSRENQGVVQAIVGLARAMGIQVIAEGVESADDLRVLQEAGCDYLQGYHLGRPAPAITILAGLAPARSEAA